MLSFFEKKQLGILSSKPSSQMLKQKNNFVFEVMEFIKWVMIDNMITQNLDMKCKIVFRILTTILHSSSSWFAKSDLFRLNSIKNVSLKKLFLVLYIMICYIAFLKSFLDFLIVYTIRIVSCYCVLNSVTKIFPFQSDFPYLQSIRSIEQGDQVQIEMSILNHFKDCYG